jgi:cation diffusion facilitator family transporter
MLVELVGGYVANSLAIMTDAAHMLSDVGGFIISLLGLHLAQAAATEEYTYGFKQAEVIGAFLSILIVWALTAGLLVKAFERIHDPENIDAPMMCGISVIGFFVNLILMKVLGHNHSHSHGGGHGHDGEDHDSVAIKAAVAHVIGDIVQSLGVCLAALLIWWQPFDIGHTETGITNWIYADPACTVLFGIMVLGTTKETIVFAMNTLMVRAPPGFDQANFLERIGKIANVESVHDLHIWSMGSAETLCTCHVMINGPQNQTACLKQCIKVAQEMGIGHSTFQIEIVGEFDPALETYGGLHSNPVTGAKTPKAADHGHAHGGKADDHGHGHDDHAHAHKDGGDSGGGCCGGHGDGGHGDHGGHGGHGDGGHGGHSGHDSGHCH